MPYTSPLPYHAEPMQAAVLHCSDGRIALQYDDFLQQGLGLARYDRIVLPGGPGCLMGHDSAGSSAASAINHLRFLVEAHELRRIVLIQHEDCGYYKCKVGADPATLAGIQKADLPRIAQAIRQAVPQVEDIEGYFARRTDGGVEFEPVVLAPQECRTTP